MSDVMTHKQREEKPTTMQSRVLIVDDDAEMREALEAVLSADGHACSSQSTRLPPWESSTAVPSTLSSATSGWRA